MWGNYVLDLIVTNLDNLFDKPCILAPLGSSDHSIVHWIHTVNDNMSKLYTKPIKLLVRRYPRFAVDAFGRWASTHQWFTELGAIPSIDDLANSFLSQVTMALDRFIPLKSMRFCHSDKLWISTSIKQLIDPQRAFHSGNLCQWRMLKYKVQTEITSRKKLYYRNKVQHLKKDDFRKWWNIVNKMSGRSEKITNVSLENAGKLLSDLELVNSLNNFYSSVNADIPPLDLTILPAYLPAVDQVPYIEPHEVCKKLLAINASKACGPDNIPAPVLKEFAYLYAQPVASICNTSLGIVPTIWKD